MLTHLAGYVAARRANAGGTISHDNRNHYVNRTLAGRDVYVSFDPLRGEWVFADRAGVEYRRQPAEELTPERVRALEVGHRRDRHAEAGRRTPPSPFPAQPHVG